MRVLVVGAGAVGSFLAATLALAGSHVTLVGRRAVEPGDRPLFVADRRGRRRRALVHRVSAAGVDAAAPPPDVIVLAVKQPDVGAAVDGLPRCPGVPIVTVQNGIGAERAVAARRPDQPVIAASLTASVELGPADVVVRLSRGGIALAPLAGAAAPVARSLAAAFERGGLRARVLGDPEAMKWSKLLANLVGNATSALLDVDPATIYRDPRLFEIERRQIREAMAVMAALGRRPVALPGADTRLLAFAFRLPSALGRPILARVVGGARGGKSPSLRLRLAEVGAADRSATVTEAAWLNGAVASEGIATRVATPVNAGLARLVDEAAGDPERRTFLRGRPDRLLRELDADGRTP